MAEQLQIRRAEDTGLFPDMLASELPSIDNQTELENAGQVKSWNHLYTLSDAFVERKPIEYVVYGLFSLPSLSILYGLPGDYKSMLLMDAAICVAAGIPWLPSEKHPNLARATVKSPVLWYDFDNGKRRCDERFQAIAKGRGLNEEAELAFYYLSVPDPALDFNNDDNVATYLEPKIQELGIKFLCVDNLTTVSGNVDENSVQMSTVMTNLRKLVERNHLACVVIHHQRKSHDKETHAGESLRGHSSINAAVDLALRVGRSADNRISVSSTKTRGSIVKPFGAVFAYTSRDDQELETARFFGERNNDEAEVQDRVKELLEEESPLNQSKIFDKLKPTSKNNIKKALDDLVEMGVISKEKAAKNASLYRLSA